MQGQPEKVFVRDLSGHTAIDTSFFCKQKEMRKKKNGDDYLMMILSDRTGDVPAFIWEKSTDAAELFNTQDFIRVQGQVRYYNGRLQLNVNRVERISDSQVEPEDYFPTSEQDTQVMFQRLMGVIEKVQEPRLKKMLASVFSDARVQERFKCVPAGKSLHHSFIGGLLEHTLSVCTLCELVAEHYGDLNRDILLAGALLHDIGKIEELGTSKGFDYTDEGRLLGHIMIGTQLVTHHMEKIEGFPEQIRVELLHIILSHHSQLEHGSPRRPKTPEALLLSFIDDMDAKIEAMRKLIQTEEHLSGAWTSYSHFFDRYLYKGGGGSPRG